MTLHNQMEEKQLDIRRPLLSVRRVPASATVPPPNYKRATNDCSQSQPSLPPLPYYKSDLKSGPYRNPGVVPFQWEQSPGRPKTKPRPQTEHSPKKNIPPSPKLPPGRALNQEQQKPTDKHLKGSPDLPSRSPQEMNPSSWELASWEKAMLVLEEPDEESKSEEASSSSESVKFEDARDKFSRNDSFFLNCSVNGVMGLDDLIPESSGNSLDPQARDFMIGRFLPAAKAVASETPQFASRRHYGTTEQSKLINRASERTVYVDSEQMVESQSSISSSSESRGRNPSVDYSLQDIKSSVWDHEQSTISQTKSLETTQYSNVFSSARSSEDVNKSDGDKKPQYGSQSNRLWGKEMMHKKQPVKPNSKEVTLKRIPSIGLSPFLPKTPSESWLSQTLPSMSPRTPSSAWMAMHANFRPSPTDPKRDRMLKASLVKQHMLLRPLGELAPILED